VVSASKYKLTEDFFLQSYIEMNEPCKTFHSVYPKYGVGSYASFFDIPTNEQNKYFVANPLDHSTCGGTRVVCYDVKFGALRSCSPPGVVNQSLRSQAVYNGQLRSIINSRPQTCPTCVGRPFLPAISGAQPWKAN
jgi:hypothetical protein